MPLWQQLLFHVTLYMCSPGGFPDPFGDDAFAVMTGTGLTDEESQSPCDPEDIPARQPDPAEAAPAEAAPAEAAPALEEAQDEEDEEDEAASAEAAPANEEAGDTGGTFIGPSNCLCLEDETKKKKAPTQQKLEKTSSTSCEKITRSKKSLRATSA